MLLGRNSDVSCNPKFFIEVHDRGDHQMRVNVCFV